MAGHDRFPEEIMMEWKMDWNKEKRKIIFGLDELDQTFAQRETVEELADDVFETCNGFWGFPPIVWVPREGWLVVAPRV